MVRGIILNSDLIIKKRKNFPGLFFKTQENVSFDVLNCKGLSPYEN